MCAANGQTIVNAGTDSICNLVIIRFAGNATYYAHIASGSVI